MTPIHLASCSCATASVSIGWSAGQQQQYCHWYNIYPVFRQETTIVFHLPTIACFAFSLNFLYETGCVWSVKCKQNKRISNVDMQNIKQRGIVTQHTRRPIPTSSQIRPCWIHPTNPCRWWFLCRNAFHFRTPSAWCPTLSQYSLMTARVHHWVAIWQRHTIWKIRVFNLDHFVV